MLQIQILNPKDGEVLVESATGLFFGSVIAGNKTSPILLKITVPEAGLAMSALQMYLQSNGGLSSTKFLYYYSEVFEEIEIASTKLVSEFTVKPNVVTLPDEDSGGLSISLIEGKPSGYLWLCLDIGIGEKTPTSNINYRFVFNYS